MIYRNVDTTCYRVFLLSDNTLGNYFNTTKQGANKYSKRS